MNVLIISVHPDDETLGCGGVLLKHQAAGDHIHWMIGTEGREPGWSKEVIAEKALEVEAVAQAFGFKKVFKLGFPAAYLDTIAQSEMMAAIRAPVVEVLPQIVYLVHGGDVNSDHHAFFNAALSVLKPFYMKRYGVQRILSYETLSSTEAAPAIAYRQFLPNVHSDITPYLERKIEIMSLYRTEVHADPFPRGPSGIRALARFRGATVSIEYAEAFMLIRELI